MVDTLMPNKYFHSLLIQMHKELPQITFFYEQRSDLSIDQMLILKNAGMNFTQVGIESLSTNILNLINSCIILL
ncbi:MAG: hypothetical protein DRP87_13860 [Spirochaetes bacterium]|nr:MAG: hypothetical protein DRP87_13860 [Spirochaetota bacterium]